MSNLYKQRYIVSSQNQCRVINSNQALEERMKELERQARQRANAQDGFVEGLNVQTVELPPPEPEISLDEIKRKADEMLEQARLQSEQMIEEAKKKTEQISEIARTQGEQQGYAMGQQKAMDELVEQKQQLETYRQSLEEEYMNKREALEPQLLSAITEVLEKVFHIQFQQNQEILLHLVRNAVLKIESSREFLVRVSEKNYQYIAAHREEMLRQVGQNIKLEVEADASMDETQCIIETDSGFFDCSIDVQLENLLKTIRTLSI